MLLFVLSTLVVFHFALPTGADEIAGQGCSVALVFTALLGLAGRGPERGGWLPLEGLVLAPSDRSAIWLGKAAAVFVFLTVIELVALPAFALFFSPLDAAAVLGVLLANVGICASGHLVRSGGWRLASRTRELDLPLLFLPLAIPPRGEWCSVRAGSEEPGRYLASWGYTTWSSPTVLGVL